MAPLIQTPLTKALKIEHPIILAGMGNVAGAELAAAVTNAGGLGVVGGFGWTPKMLRQHLKELKELLVNPKAPFGVDLLLPQVGGDNARKTNKDYTKGTLPELIDIIIEEGATLFVSAVGVPPAWVVEKLHKNGILVANMVGHPRHAAKAVPLGIDFVIAQGSEAGGHTGDIATSVLIPQVVDAVRGFKSPLLGTQIEVVGAGGIYDGRGLAMCFSLGASAAWVGTRFVAAKESNASPHQNKLICEGDSGDTVRSEIYTGRPLRVIKNPYNMKYEDDPKKREESRLLRSKGVIPWENDMQDWESTGNFPPLTERFPVLAGQAIGGIKEVLSAKQIIDNMVSECAKIIRHHQSYLVSGNTSSQASRL